jgi:hypothetical protein
MSPIARSAIVVTLLSIALVGEALWFARRHSITYDETIYLNLSLQSLRDRRLDPEFMRLGVAPLPVLLTYAGPLWSSVPEPRPSVQAARVTDPQLIGAPRFLNALLFGVPLVVLVFVWLYRRRGLSAAALGGAMVVLSPTIAAHASLATTDEALAFFSTLALATIAWSAASPGFTHLVICAVVIAAAMSAKYTAVYLLPVAAAAFLLSSLRRQFEQGGSQSLWKAIGEGVLYSGVVMCLVLPLWWAGHLFVRGTPAEPAAQNEHVDVARLERSSVRGFVLSLAPVLGIRRQIAHTREGDNAFLLGERSNTGWWYYFPLMFLFKSTPAELSLALFLIVAGMAAIWRPWRTLMALDSSMQSLLVAAVVFIPLLLASHLNQGQRYMIPLYPIVIIAACDYLAARLENRGRWFLAVTVLLVVSQAWSSVAIAPHYLAYVNGFVGGSKNAWRLMADSSLDWGQDLPELRKYLEARDRGPVAMKYFGTALPEAYGVQADDIEHLRKDPEQYGVLALSVTYLNGLHLSGRDPFKEFRRLEPSAQVGYSIMVYDLRRPDALFAFREALKVMH